MVGNRLNVLAIGSNPNLLYYSLKLQGSSKFNIHTVNQALDAEPEISFIDNNFGDFKFKPDLVVNELNQLSSKVKYDIFLISSKSLQDISNVANSLTPLLNKNSIILVESTGFINLEPFLKNCLPSNLQLSVFSIMLNADIREIETNQFIILNKQREIFIGESNTNTSKYSKATQQNLNALSKLFQYDNKDDVKVILKSTYLEFLIEEWKIAIPKICFDPLLILFEEKDPSKLSNQILAKPLLSGLVTELITVAKTMGCKLPVGFDNESNFLKNWTSNYSNKSNSDIEYLDSPSLFYNLFHKIDLNIDLLLLQPILLADDYGIKTPYLEFLYATICQFEKLNLSKNSIFFQRLNETETNGLKENLNLKSVEFDQQKIKLEKLIIQNQELISNYDQLNLKFNNSINSFDQLRNEKLNLQQQVEQSELKFQQLQKANQSLENQLTQSQQALQKAKEAPIKVATIPIAKSSQDLRKIMEQSSEPEQVQQQAQPIPTQISVEGTPDLRDLTDVAIYSAQFDSPTIQQQPQSSENTEPVAPKPELKVQIPNQQASSREIELQRREQLLMNREMELNKKLSNINLNRGPNGAPIQPQFQPQQPQFPPQNHQPPPQQGQHQQHQQPQNHQYQPYNQYQTSPPQTVQSRFNNPQFQQGGNHPTARRISTMPILESEQMYASGGMNHQGGFKTTSRKNRKSSFPLVSTSNIGDGFNNRINGSQMNGPQMNGPQMNGPQVNGPQMSGPPRNGGKRYNNQMPYGGRANSMMSSSMLNLSSQNGFSNNHSQQQYPQPPKVSNSMSFNGSSSSFGEQQPQPFSNGSRSLSVNQLQSHSFSQPQPMQTLSHSTSRTDLLNGSTIKKLDSNEDESQQVEEEYEPKPLGVISDPNDKKNEKKKFGLFKKKK